VKTALEATSFITKIIAYEKGKWPDGTRLKDDWSKRVVLVSDNWGGWIWINPSGSESPVPNSYHHPPEANHSLIFLGSTPDPNWSLLAYLNETDVRLLPYRLDAGAEIRGWYFARSNTDLSPNIVVTPFFELPAPTPWIVVYAAGEELSPSNYILNSTQLDGSVIDQEMLREQIKSDMPAFDNITRLYVDIDSMSPDQIDAAPIERFSEVGLTRVLNAGPHIVSLSGHGSQDGCCGLSRGLADRLVNTHRPFILYACSCLTNWVDDDSMSEHITVNPRGGAVAYIGYTRYSFIAAGDDFQQRFFRGSTSLGSNANLGILNDTRASLFDTFGWHVGGWSIAALHLTGDPEMPLWGTKEEFFNIPDYIPVDWLKLIIGSPQTPPSPISNNWGLTFVHISQGIREVNGVADPSGKIELPLRGFHPGPATLTIARAGHLHVEKEVILQKTKKPFIKRVAVLLLLAVVLAILFAVWVFLIQRK
jgi:peptidase C25-like protein